MNELRARKLLDWFIRSDYFQSFDSDNRGNDMFINDPDRANRCHEAAIDGCDGSTTSEIIDDWYHALQLFVSDHNTPLDRVQTAIEHAISSCEQWHINNGSIDEQGS